MATGRIEPQAVVIFGASGDLTRRKLIPAFYHLFCENLLPGGFALVGLVSVMPNDFTTLVGAIRFNWTEYWPRSLMLVPPATALTVVVVAARAPKPGQLFPYQTSSRGRLVPPLLVLMR